VNKTNNIELYDIKAEQAVLGSIIFDNEKFITSGKWIDHDSFYHIPHQHIYKAISELYFDKNPIDEITIGDQLKKSNNLEGCGGLVYLAELIECCPSVGSIDYYAAMIKEHSIARQAQEILINGNRKIRDPEQNIPEVIEELHQSLNDLSITEEKRSTKVKEILSGCFNTMEKRSETKEDVTGIPSGFIDLDKTTSGFQNSDLIIIAGRPAMGKSALSLNCALHAAKSSKKKGVILIFSIEMPKEQLGFRLLAIDSKTNTKKFLNGNFEGEDWDKLAMSADRISPLPIVIDDTPGISINSLLSTCRYYNQIEKEGVSMVIIDYLQLVRGNKKLSREQQISEITSSCKNLAKEIDIPVIALSQLNRSLEKRTDKRPQLSDLRESGSIEQDADLIIFIYRDEVYEENSKDKGIAELDIAKHRNGPTGMVRVSFQGQYTKFGNLSKYEQPNH